MIKIQSPYGAIPIVSFCVAEIYEPANDKGQTALSLEDVIRQQAWLLTTIRTIINGQAFRLSQVQTMSDVSSVMGNLLAAADMINNYDTTPWVVQ